MADVKDECYAGKFIKRWSDIVLEFLERAILFKEKDLSDF